MLACKQETKPDLACKVRRDAAQSNGHAAAVKFVQRAVPGVLPGRLGKVTPTIVPMNVGTTSPAARARVVPQPAAVAPSHAAGPGARHAHTAGQAVSNPQAPPTHACTQPQYQYQASFLIHRTPHPGHGVEHASFIAVSMRWRASRRGSVGGAEAFAAAAWATATRISVAWKS